MQKPNNIAQRIANGKSTYGQLLDGKPAVNVQPPNNINIGVLEICTFFPNWFQIPEVIVRAIRNGWTRRGIAKAQLHADNQLRRAHLKTAENRIQKQMSEGGNLWSGYKKGEPWNLKEVADLGQEDDLTANGWQLRCEHDPDQKFMSFEHITLADIRNQVPRARWPTGQDRLLLTQCLEFAEANPHLDLDTSHYDWIIRSQNLADDPNLDGQHDADALDRLNDQVDDPSR